MLTACQYFLCLPSLASITTLWAIWSRYEGARKVGNRAPRRRPRSSGPLHRHATASTSPTGAVPLTLLRLSLHPPIHTVKIQDSREPPPPTERWPGLQPPSYSHGSVPDVGTESGRLRLISRSGPGGGSTRSSKANGTGKAQEEMVPGTSRRPWRAMGRGSIGQPGPAIAATDVGHPEVPKGHLDPRMGQA